MGKVIEKIKLTSLFDPTKSVEVEAVIDTGATMLVLPQSIVEELHLRKMREVSVRYANNKTEVKPIYGVVTVEIQGRAGEFNVLGEPDGSQSLVGQVGVIIKSCGLPKQVRRCILGVAKLQNGKKP